MGEIIYGRRESMTMTNNFTKVVRFATDKTCNNKDYSIYAEIKFTNGNLSISGVEGPTRDGNCAGACGQIVMHLKDDIKSLTPTPQWTVKMIEKFLSIWDEWHLNDMRAGCEHQRASWNLEAPIELRTYSWTKEFYNRRYKAEKGELTTTEYETYQDHVQMVNKLIFTTNNVRYESEAVKVAIELGLIKEEVSERKTKSAGWVNYRTHPEGLLSKPCEICQYPYGSKWLREEVPTEVVEWLKALPETDITPAWV